MSGPDIFVSYARHDAKVARRYADGFENAGFEVWWDDARRSGEASSTRLIEAALRAAKAVVVLWSPASVSSRWVRAEATLADRQNTLVPVTIAACERPIIFELIHTVDMSHWKGNLADPAWREFIAGVRDNIADRGALSETLNSNVAKAADPRLSLDRPCVMVLPFANMSGDPEQEYFADGITEDIITDLAKVSALGVISHNSALVFKGKQVDIPDIARQLNVTHVLEGSVRKAGERVRITAQLIDGFDNNHLWADRYDRDLADIFAIQDELSQRHRRDPEAQASSRRKAGHRKARHG